MILFRKTPHDRYRTYHLCEAGRNDGSLLWPVLLASLCSLGTGYSSTAVRVVRHTGLLEIHWVSLGKSPQRDRTYYNARPAAYPDNWRSDPLIQAKSIA